jgi:hypothetical protein
VKRTPQPSKALLITLILLTALQATALIPMLFVAWYSTNSFGPGGQFNPGNPWLPVVAAVAPLALMLPLSATAWVLYAAGRPRTAVAISVAAFAFPIAEAIAVCMILLFLMSLP